MIIEKNMSLLNIAKAGKEKHSNTDNKVFTFDKWLIVTNSFILLAIKTVLKEEEQYITIPIGVLEYAFRNSKSNFVNIEVEENFFVVNETKLERKEKTNMLFLMQLSAIFNNSYYAKNFSPFTSVNLIKDNFVKLISAMDCKNNNISIKYIEDMFSYAFIDSEHPDIFGLAIRCANRENAFEKNIMQTRESDILALPEKVVLERHWKPLAETSFYGNIGKIITVNFTIYKVKGKPIGIDIRSVINGDKVITPKLLLISDADKQILSKELLQSAIENYKKELQ